MKRKSVYDRVFIHEGTDCIVDVNYKICESYLLSVNKPNCGLWGSTYTPGEKYLSAWDKFNKINLVKAITGKYVFFKLKEEAKILELDKLEDYEDKYVEKSMLKRRDTIAEKLKELDFSDKEKAYSFLMDYYTASISLGSALKWKEILEDFDGIYLPESHVSQFSMWDVESIVILNTNKIDVIDKNDVAI